MGALWELCGGKEAFFSVGRGGEGWYFWSSRSRSRRYSRRLVLELVGFGTLRTVHRLPVALGNSTPEFTESP